MNYKLLAINIMAAAAMFTTAQASTITGSIWEGILNTTPADAADLPSGTPNVTFSLPGGNIFFSSYGAGLLTGNPTADYTVGSFLGTGGATGITYNGTAASGDSMLNVFMFLTGQVTVTSGEVFNITHDDGATLVINGVTVASYSGVGGGIPTSGPWSGASGTYTFDLYYDNVQAAPAYLDLDQPFNGSSGVPDSGMTAALLGMGLVSLGALRRKLSF